MKTYYDKLANNNFVIGENAKINFELLKPMCHIKVNVKCERCDNTNIIALSKYNQNKLKYGFYSCKKCSNEKRKLTVKELYGVDSVSQRIESREKQKIFMSSSYFREKSKETQIEKYGTLYVKTDEFKNIIKNINENTKNIAKEKRKQTNLIEYGNICPLQNSIIKEKRKKSMIEKYGFEYSTQSPEIFDKIKKVFKEKYGTEYAVQSNIIKNKIKDIFLLKYGVGNPWANKSIINKLKKTWLSKYGVDNPMKNIIIREKALNTRIFNGNCIDLSNLEGYEKYTNMVRKLSIKNKKELLKNWDGYDFYDNEYIKDNFNLYNTNKLYPVVDHKISVFNGYLLGIEPEEISDISNLCVTKRWINGMKSTKNAVEFIETFKSINI